MSGVRPDRHRDDHRARISERVRDLGGHARRRAIAGGRDAVREHGHAKIPRGVASDDLRRRTHRADEIARAVGRDRAEERVDVVRSGAPGATNPPGIVRQPTSHAMTVTRSRRSISCVICTAGRFARAKRSPEHGAPGVEHDDLIAQLRLGPHFGSFGRSAIATNGSVPTGSSFLRGIPSLRSRPSCSPAGGAGVLSSMPYSIADRPTERRT